MTPVSMWRTDLAHALARHYAAMPGVVAIFVGGSTARGQADRFSDLELAVIWNRAPSEQDRAAVIARAGGDLHRLYPYDPHAQVWEDIYFVGRDHDDRPKSGCHVEITHLLLDALEERIHRVLDAFDPDLDLQTLLAGIVDGVALLNEPLVTRWKADLQPFPDGLQRAVIQRYGVIDHFWRYEMLIARGDNRMELAALFTQTLHSVLLLLCGLNRVYFGGFKWLDDMVSRFALAPHHLGERIRRVYTLPPVEAAREVIRLVDETFSVIEAHVPSTDVARFRQVFHYRRAQWESTPPHGMSSHPDAG